MRSKLRVHDTEMAAPSEWHCGISRVPADQNGTSTNPSGVFARQATGPDQTLGRDPSTGRDIAALESKRSRNFGAIHGSTAVRHRILARTQTLVCQGETT